MALTVMILMMRKTLKVASEGLIGKPMGILYRGVLLIHPKQ